MAETILTIIGVTVFVLVLGFIYHVFFSCVTIPCPKCGEPMLFHIFHTDSRMPSPVSYYCPSCGYHVYIDPMERLVTESQKEVNDD